MMEVQLTSNLNALARLMQRNKASVPDAAVMGLDRAAQIVKQQSDRQVRKINARPIPTRAQVSAYNRTGRVGMRKITRKDGSVTYRRAIGGSGKKAWQRTGQLASGETIVQRGRYERHITTTGPAAVYSDRRQGIGVTWTPKNPALGIIRKNNWRKDAADITRPQVGKAFEIEVKKQLRMA